LQVTNNAAAINKIVTPYQEAFPGSPVLTNVGGALKMSDGTVLGTIIGSARNYAGTNGPNIITRGTSGRVTVWALDGGGHPVFGQTLDPAYVLGTNVTVIGAGTNFAGKGGYNLFIREAAGQVTAWEFDSNGHGLYGKTLDSAYVLSTNVTIIGAGANFSGNGGRNVFIREAAGQVTVWEFDSTGHGIFGQTLDSGFTLGTNVSVIGGGMNFNSSGGHDVFIREAGGQVTVWEFNAAGHGTYGQTLNASFTVGTNVAVMGAGQNLFANGGHDVFIRNSTGQLTAYEFVSGNLTSSAALKNTDGSNFLINGGVFMSGTIIDPVTSKTDIILQSANGQKTTYGLSSQQLTALSVLGTSGNDVLVASSGTETLTGNGGYDAYQFGAVFGQDTVANNGGGTPKGEIDLSSAASNQLWFKHTGNDLEIDLVGTTKKITVAGWYGSNAGAQVQSVNASDGLKLDTQLAQLVAAMAAYSANHAGFNPATATQMPADSALQSALAASWHH
jgi:hypothetical protein